MNLYAFREKCDFVHVQAIERIVHLPKRYDEAISFGETTVEGGTTASAPAAISGAPPPSNQPDDCEPEAPPAPTNGYEEKPAETGCCGGKCVIQ